MNIKKELIFSFIAIVFFSFFIVKTIQNYYKENSSFFAKNNQKKPQSTNSSNQSNQNQTIILTLDEVAKHNSPNDCWLIINDNVYEVTNYINNHPGGAKRIISFCGQDATTAFATKGNKNKPHSSSANQILESFKIGFLNQQIKINQNSNNLSPSKNNNYQFKNQFEKTEEEYEDD